MLKRPRVLITGISGLLGSNLALCWRSSMDISGIYKSIPIHIQGVDVYQADLTDYKTACAVIKQLKPDIIVHTAALANIDPCEKNEDLAYQMNVEMAIYVMKAAQSIRAKMVFISTDAVYPGTKGFYSEDQVGEPINIYAATKIAAEQELSRLGELFIVRTSFYGFNSQAKQSLGEWVAVNVMAGKPINGFTDVISSNIFTYDLAILLKASIDKNLSGIFNVACQDALSKYDFACMIAKNLGVNNLSLIKPVSIDEGKLIAVRSKNLSLNTTKLSTHLDQPLPKSLASIKHFTDCCDNHPFKGKTWLS